MSLNDLSISSSVATTLDECAKFELLQNYLKNDEIFVEIFL